MDANKFIDACGGTTIVARACEVTTGAVSQWRTNGIPRARVMFLELKFPATRKLSSLETDHVSHTGASQPFGGESCSPATHEEA